MYCFQERVITQGMPNIAQLAAVKEFWAVKNLIRRQVVPDGELLERHDGKDVFEWSRDHEEWMLLEELEYRFKVHQISEKSLSNSKPCLFVHVLQTYFSAIV